MVIESKKFKDVCSKIAYSLDKGTDQSGLTDLIELECKGNTLHLNVTNKEYFISIKFPLTFEENFKVTVSALTFLKLISQLTTDNIELIVKDKFLNILANGDYKIPIIYAGDKIMELPKIEINNPMVEMPVDNNILKSIYTYNSKELLKGPKDKKRIQSPIQKLHYIDDQGAITFTLGACVNNFKLPKPIKILLNDKIVKLFKLFEEDEVQFTLGYDQLSETIIQTKIKIETKDIILTSVLNCDDSLIKKVPAEKIRETANKAYPYTITINKNLLIQSINRLIILMNNYASKVAYFEFNSEGLNIYDETRNNKEILKCEGFSGESYSCLIDLEDLKITLDTCPDQYLVMSFGSDRAIVINRLNISILLPECELE